MGFVCRIIGRTTMDKVSRALRGHAARPQSPLPDWVPAASVVHSCRFTTPQPRAPDLLPILAREAHQRRATLRRSIGYPTWRSSSASPDAAQCSRRPPDLVVRSAPRQTLANARPRRRSSLSPCLSCLRRQAPPPPPPAREPPVSHPSRAHGSLARPRTRRCLARPRRNAHRRDGPIRPRRRPRGPAPGGRVSQAAGAGGGQDLRSRRAVRPTQRDGARDARDARPPRRRQPPPAAGRAGRARCASSRGCCRARGWVGGGQSAARSARAARVCRVAAPERAWGTRRRGRVHSVFSRATGHIHAQAPLPVCLAASCRRRLGDLGILSVGRASGHASLANSWRKPRVRERGPRRSDRGEPHSRVGGLKRSMSFGASEDSVFDIGTSSSRENWRGSLVALSSRAKRRAMRPNDHARVAGRRGRRVAISPCLHWWRVGPL